MNKLIYFYKTHRIYQILTLLLLSIIIGFLWFLLLYGRYPLYFTNVYWIYNSGGDLFQHQLGWEFFRQEPWHFPLGRIVNYGYPYGTYLTFMDSIPLFAFPFKLLSPLLTQHFQYLGIWELTSVIGQLFFGALILNEFSPSFFKNILGASLLVLSPPLIFRVFYHNSLTAQWILLAAIWFIFLEYRHRLWRGAWLVLFSVALLVHLYFVAMLIPLWGVSLFFRYSREKKKWGLILDVCSVLGIMLLASYCLGYFSLKINDLADFGFGYYSWNLNEFINPLSYSSILNKMPLAVPEQYEGFSYLGLGNLIIFSVAFLLYFQKDYSSRQLKFILPLIFISVLFILFAFSNKAFVNNFMMWEIHLPKFANNLCSAFRSSGRFIWPVFYFLVLFGLISVNRNLKYSTPLLVLALVIQLIDIQPLYSAKKISGFSDYHSPIQGEFWQEASKTNEHIVILPATQDLLSFYEPIALYAQQNEMTLNWGYFSRADYKTIEKDGEQIWNDLLANKIDNKTLYLLWDPKFVLAAKESLSANMLVCKVDGYNVVLSKDNKLVQNNIDLSHYCGLP